MPDYFSDLLVTYEKKLAGWKRKLLSPGGRIILIKHVLQSLPIYNIATMDPPKAILNIIEAIYVNFFRCDGEDDFKSNWMSWKKIFLPCQE